ncbi:hypothetical protein C8R45DRAFT_1112738 [Mycena sanguinolenta]|nr:hypothetical protein C8R45DRAFT_1112738 [Mycena sanguinolenta]
MTPPCSPAGCDAGANDAIPLLPRSRLEARIPLHATHQRTSPWMRSAPAAPNALVQNHVLQDSEWPVHTIPPRLFVAFGTIRLDFRLSRVSDTDAGERILPMPSLRIPRPAFIRHMHMVHTRQFFIR